MKRSQQDRNMYSILLIYLQANYCWPNSSQLFDVLQLCRRDSLQSCHLSLLVRAHWDLSWILQHGISDTVHISTCTVSFHQCCFHQGLSLSFGINYVRVPCFRLSQLVWRASLDWHSMAEGSLQYGEACLKTFSQSMFMTWLLLFPAWLYCFVSG